MNEEIVWIGNRALGLDEIVDAELASRIIGLAERTVRNLAVRRKLPVYKVGTRANRFLVRDLIEWAEDRRVEPPDAVHDVAA